MATITVKSTHHGMFDSVAKAALEYYARHDVFSVSFDFNSRIYVIDHNTTMESLYYELMGVQK